MYIKMIYFIFIMILLFNLPSVSEEKDNLTESIQTLNNTISIKIFAESSKLSLGMDNDEGGENSKGIYYSPSNAGLNAGIEIAYDDFGLSYSKKIIQNGYDMENFDRPDYGKTEQTDVQIYYYTRSYGIELYYQHYKGFYLENPSSLGVSKNNPEFVREDLEIKNIGGNYIYAFSKNYSLKAPFNLTERQTKYEYSWLVMIPLYYVNIHSNFSLIPPDVEEYYGKYAGFKSGTFYGTGILGGLGATIPFYKFYFNIALLMGAGVIEQQFNTSSGEINKFTTNFLLSGKLAIGYNGDNFFSGITYDLDAHDSTFSSSNFCVTIFRGNLKIFTGIRW
jgi:hypothetical protein